MTSPTPADYSTAHALLAKLGPTKSQTAADWRGPFALPSEIAEYYQRVGPASVSIDGWFTEYIFPSLADLWDFQAGYRWNANTREAISDWDDNWLVVVSEGANPFVFDRSTGSVKFAFHGQGDWEFEEWFPHLPAMTSCLAVIGSVLSEAREEHTEGDLIVKPVYRDKVIQEIADILGSKSKAAYIAEVAGLNDDGGE